MRTGVFYAVLAFLCWGLIPLYFKSLHHVPPIAVLLNRMVWALVFMGGLLVLWRHWRWLGGALRNRKVMIGCLSSAVMLSLNWFTYIWAVNNGHVVDASLGYFINPLVNVLAGFVLLHEKLRRGQWLCIGLAASGVLWLTWVNHAVPWISLILAFSFAAYGLLRKTAALGAMEGLAMETIVLFPFAALGLAWLGWNGQDGFIAGDTTTKLLLLASGPVTAIPLLLFALGARRIPFSTLGVLQYIAPSVQLLLGVLIFNEPFSTAQLAGYATIWATLALYSAEGLWQSRRKSMLATP